MTDSPISTKLEDDVPPVLRPLAEQWNSALTSTLEFMFSEDGGAAASQETMATLFEIVLQSAAGVFGPAQYDRHGRKRVEAMFANALRTITDQFAEDFAKASGEGETRQ